MNAVPSILIAEGNTSQQLLIDIYLSCENYQVHFVSDGLEALEFLKHHTPDLIVLDVNMPTVGGVDICGRIRKVRRLKDVPVVLTAPAQDERIKQEAQWVQATEVLFKPLSIDMFKAAVKNALVARPAREAVAA